MLEILKEKLDASEKKMKKVVDHLQKEYGSIRAGRANPAVLDKIPVDYFGTPTPINQVAAISVSEGRMLLITPWDPQMIRPISKAILASELGITPTDDGKTIRLVFPQPTEDRRKEKKGSVVALLSHKMAEHRGNGKQRSVQKADPKPGKKHHADGGDVVKACKIQRIQPQKPVIDKGVIGKAEENTPTDGRAQFPLSVVAKQGQKEGDKRHPGQKKQRREGQGQGGKKRRAKKPCKRPCKKLLQTHHSKLSLINNKILYYKGREK